MGNSDRLPQTATKRKSAPGQGGLRVVGAADVTRHGNLGQCNHPNGGDWDTAADWVGSVLPGSSDDVVISLAANGLVTHTQGSSDSIHS